jgi:hypothetical protein
VITTSRGLVTPDTRVSVDDLVEFASVDLNVRDARYREPLVRDAARLAGMLAEADEVVLLGSVATGKYVDVLQECLGPRLRYPAEFVGRGDMSRGGLLFRCVDGMTELSYVPIGATPRRGPRPPKLEPRR